MGGVERGLKRGINVRVVATQFPLKLMAQSASIVGSRNRLSLKKLAEYHSKAKAAEERSEQTRSFVRMVKAP